MYYHHPLSGGAATSLENNDAVCPELTAWLRRLCTAAETAVRSAAWLSSASALRAEEA